MQSQFSLSLIALLNRFFSVVSMLEDKNIKGIIYSFQFSSRHWVREVFKIGDWFSRQETSLTLLPSILNKQNTHFSENRGDRHIAESVSKAHWLPTFHNRAVRPVPCRAETDLTLTFLYTSENLNFNLSLRYPRKPRRIVPLVAWRDSVFWPFAEFVEGKEQLKTVPPLSRVSVNNVAPPSRKLRKSGWDTDWSSYLRVVQMTKPLQGHLCASFSKCVPLSASRSDSHNKKPTGFASGRGIEWMKDFFHMLVSPCSF